MRKSYKRRLWILPAAFVVLLAVSAPGFAAFTWEDNNTRFDNRPNTNLASANGATTGFSGSAWLDGPPAIGTTTNGTNDYVHVVWESDKTGDETQPYVDYQRSSWPGGGDGCDVTDPDGAMGGTWGNITVPYCSGIFYQRTTSFANGATPTWTNTIRVSPATTHARNTAMATAGNNVYVGYSTTVGTYAFQCQNDPRPVYVRTSTNDGGTFGSPVLISGATERADYFNIAASKEDPTLVFVIWTDQSTGKIKVGKSTNSGTSFTVTNVGQTYGGYTGSGTDSLSGGCTNPTPSEVIPAEPDGLEGYSGLPAIATTGVGGAAYVGIVWSKGDEGRLVAKISTDGGTTYSSTVGLAPNHTKGPSKLNDTTGCGTAHDSNNAVILPTGLGDPGTCGFGYVAAAADDGNRVGFVWQRSGDQAASTTQPRGVWFRSYTSGAWSSRTLVACYQTTSPCAGGAQLGATHQDGYGIGIAPYGTTGWGVVWTACPIGPAVFCDEGMTDPGAELIYKESGTNGATWGGSWGAASNYTKVAVNYNSAAMTCAPECGDVDSETHEYPSLMFDADDSATGCAQRGGAVAQTGGPAVGCKVDIYYLGRVFAYTTYRVYIQQGTQA